MSIHRIAERDASRKPEEARGQTESRRYYSLALVLAIFGEPLVLGLKPVHSRAA